MGKSEAVPLYKKGDKHVPEDYRPTWLIQTLLKISATWQCAQLTDLTYKHPLRHKCQQGGCKNHRCGDHIYDVVSGRLLSKGSLYHLYIDLNKTLNPISLAALWTTLHGYGLPEELIACLRRLYVHVMDQSLVNGVPTRGHAQSQGVRQGCPLSPLLFNLYLKLMFFHRIQIIHWDMEESLHAVIDDILFRARSIQDIKTVYEAFHGPARQLGLAMNISKTELHMLGGANHTTIRSRFGGILSTTKPDGTPHQVYKYRCVFVHTSDCCNQVFHLFKGTISFFFATGPFGPHCL